MVSAAIIAVLLISAFVGVVTLGSRTAAAAPFRSLRIGTTTWSVTTFNPMAITLVDEYIIIYTVYSTLLTHDASYNIRGDLAYAWNLAPDNVTWTFHLAQNAYFIDPTNPTDRSHQVTAADVVYTYYLQMNQTASILHAYTTDIQTVQAVDPFTVQIVTDRPVATMYSTAANIPIFPAYFWEQVHGPPVKYSPKYPIGSGGYYYDSVNSGANLAILLKNPSYYWDTYYCQVMKPDEIRYISYDNAGQMVSDFQHGANQLNAIIGVDPTTYKGALVDWSPKWAVDQGFVGEYSINLMTAAQRAQYVAAGNSSFKTGSNNQLLANNWTVRRAIAMSVDKQGLIDDALLGLGNVGDSLIPDTNPWHYTPPAQYTYPFDTAAARAMLNAAGWKYDATGALNPSATPLYQKGATNNTVYWPLIFRFYTLNTEDWWKKAAGDIVTWLSDAGIETTDLHGNAGFGAYSINQMSGYWLSADYDMWLWDWVFTPASDPSTDIMEVETAAAIGPTSDNFYNNATYDALYAQSVTTLDPTARRNILNEMQMMVYNESSYIIPFYKDDLYAALIGQPGTGGQAWENWGDWGTQNGLTPDSDLMNLWAQVDPSDNPSPVIASFPQVTWVNGTAATISLTVNDPEAAYLNYSFDFGDGSPVYNTTTVPVTHTYALPGNYTISVRVTNSEFPACGSTTATIVKAGSINIPPTAPVIQGSSHPTWYVNQSYDVTATSSDPDSGDTLNFTWTWGDGTQTYCPADQAVTNCTTSGGTSTASHAYNRITTLATGPYVASVAVSDGHAEVATQNPVHVNVTAPPPSHGWLAGVIKDSITGNPIQGAVVTTTPGNSASSATPAGGTYNITLAPGLYNATAVAQYYLDSAPQQVTISLNTTTVLNINLVANLGWITGTVTSNTTHAPIANAAVVVTLTGSSTPLTSGHTDAQGQYNISVEPGTYIVNASASGYLAASQAGVVVTAGHATSVPFALDLFNLPPQILSYTPNELTTYPNITLWFNLSAKDYEGDPLFVTWTFGDGATATNYTATGTATRATMSQTHAYTALGTYKAVVTVTDNLTSPGLNHHPQANVTVSVTTPPSKATGGPVQSNWLIDYGIPILVVAVIVVAVAAVLWRRRKKAQKEEAEVEEEPKPSPPAPPPQS